MVSRSIPDIKHTLEHAHTWRGTLEYADTWQGWGTLEYARTSGDT